METIKKKPATKKQPVAKKPKVEKKQYHLNMKFNDTVFDVETDDLKEAILSIKPFHLKTRILFEIEKDDKKCGGVLSGMKGRMIFKNRISLMVFINRLIFK